jgi:hypothetical protein
MAMPLAEGTVSGYNSYTFNIKNPTCAEQALLVYLFAV